MNALHFGAGNIGRGFIGKLLVESGYHVIFADVNETLIQQLNEQGQYSVQVVGEGVHHTDRVDHVRGVNSQDEAVLIDLIANVSLVTTAVGPNVLKRIAPSIAKGLVARFAQNPSQPLNIIACENMVRATSFLKEEVFSYLTPEQQTQVEKRVGFVDSAVDRIVPPAQNTHANPLGVTVEVFSEWIVDKTQFKGKIPAIEGMELTDNLMAFVERKLFTLNTGHAITAYLGKQKGYHTVKEAIEDQDIYQQVKATMQESGNVLIQRYQFDKMAHAHYIEKILKRFANPYLKDDVDRVGREPLRKLSATDRLIKPLLGTLEYHLPHQALLKSIAVALHYRNEQDPQAQELTHSLDSVGVAETLRKYTGLTQQTVIDQIVDYYHQ